MGDNGFAEMARQAEGQRVAQEWVERALAAEARLADARTLVSRLHRYAQGRNHTGYALDLLQVLDVLDGSTTDSAGDVAP